MARALTPLRRPGLGGPRSLVARKIRHPPDVGGRALRRILRMWGARRGSRAEEEPCIPRFSVNCPPSAAARCGRGRGRPSSAGRRSGPAVAGATGRTRPAGSSHPPSPTTWTGRSAPGRPRRGRAGRLPPITPPEAAMTIPSGATSGASDLSGMSGPHGMLTLQMSGRASSPVLVGRNEQMAALEAAFASARQGGPSAVLLGGEAGVGKSRLVSEFGRTAAAAGARVLTGGCLELGTDGLPFAPFTAVLRDLVHEMGADAVASMLPGRTTRGLARLLPELGEPDTAGDPAEARARLFEEVLRALEHLTRHSPVVLVIEDAHWADRSSRDLLTFLIGNQRALSGLLIVVTFP